jgi:hypothetical protein
VLNVVHMEREQSAKSFEDREISVEELKNAVFNSLYIWIVAYNSQYFSLFFLDFFFLLFLLNRGFILCNSYVLGLHHLLF